MTQETDKTQAIIDFIQFSFHSYPENELVGNQGDD